MTVGSTGYCWYLRRISCGACGDVVVCPDAGSGRGIVVLFVCGVSSDVLSVS